MLRIYIDTPLKNHEKIILEDKIFHYAFRVLRCKNGQAMILFNGDGYDYYGRFQQLNKKQGEFHIETVTANDNESPVHTTLIQGLSKGERMDIAIQKSVELGVNSIYPVQTDFCAVKISPERQLKKQHHWQSIAISACEQSRRAFVPNVAITQPLDKVIKDIQADLLIALHPETPSKTTLKQGEKHANKQHNSFTLKPLAPSPRRIALAIGPEGGFSEREISAMQSYGFHLIQMGPRILRTETAAIAGLSFIQQKWGDWHV